jgi:hypothetical protein
VDTPPPSSSSGSPPRSRWSRVAMHLVGLLAAGVIAWLLWRGWRQPELLLDLANMRLC